MARYRCTVCNWMYDEGKEGVPFTNLPDSYTCPNCGAPKSAFVCEGVAREQDEKVLTTVADEIVEQMVTLGIKVVSGIPGDSNLPLIDAIRRHESIRFVLTRHEETAAFMASAHGKMTDHIGACISIAGPGSTNLITGLMDASADRAPVLALAGQVAEVYLGSEAFQEIDQLELFHPFTVYSETVARANQALKLVINATKHAYARPGVAVLSTPTDVLVERFVGKVYKPRKRVFIDRNPADENKVLLAAGLIDNFRRVVIIAGWGVRHASENLLKLGGKLSAPIATTSRAKGVIHETHPSSLGVLGSIGSRHAARMIQQAELILVVGTGFRHANLVPAGLKIVQIDRDPTRIGRTFDIDAGLVGDAEIVLGQLLDKTNHKERDEEYWGRIEILKAGYHAELEADARDMAVPVSPGYAIQALKRHADRDAVITVDVGDHTYWFFKKFQCEGQRVFLSANIASMGFALPAALSAKLDYPDHQVICLTGDGGFGMLGADFTTAVREGLAIKVVVFNDGKLKNIKKEQASNGYPEYGVSFPNPNFAEFAESCGGEGYHVEDPHQLDRVLETAFGSDHPALVEILVDPDKMAAATKSPD